MDKVRKIITIWDEEFEGNIILKVDPHYLYVRKSESAEIMFVLDLSHDGGKYCLIMPAQDLGYWPFHPGGARAGSTNPIIIHDKRCHCQPIVDWRKTPMFVPYRIYRSRAGLPLSRMRGRLNAQAMLKKGDLLANSIDPGVIAED